jgi:AraC-like DNA-binding protein
MPSKLTGALYAYESHALYVGPLIASARHSHHAGQVMWVPGGLDVEDESGAHRNAGTHVVPPHRFHAHAAAAGAAVLWVDRDDLPWDRTPAIPPDASSELPSTLGARLDGPLAPDEAHDVARALLRMVTPDRGSLVRSPRHPAVMRMCALLDDNASARELDMAALATRSGLSARQLRHRFTQELGINPSAYLRWRRLRRAIASIAQGATLTRASVEGGFADAAHFSRVFQAQFGMAPSQALSQIRFMAPLG